MKVEYFHIPETCTADTYNRWGVAYGLTYCLLAQLRSSYYFNFRCDYTGPDDGEWSLDAPEYMPTGGCVRFITSRLSDWTLRGIGYESRELLHT